MQRSGAKDTEDKVRYINAVNRLIFIRNGGDMNEG